MNSRERLINCITHKKIDRVPISTYEMVPYLKDDFYSQQPSYSNMMQFFREYTDCIYSTAPLHTPINDFTEIIEERFDDHVIVKTILHLKGKDLVKIHKTYDNVYTNWTLKHFCEDLSDLQVYIDNLPDMICTVSTEHVHEIEKKLGNNGIMMQSMADPLCTVADSFDFAKFMIYAIEEPEFIYKACDAVFEFQKYHFDKMIKQGVKDMMIRIYGPEYATPPYLSPKMYPNLVTKYLKYFNREVKAAGGFPRVHCHGKIKDALEEFLKTDMMALEPIEPIPDGDISLGDVKKRCGNSVCLMGSMELRDLESATRLQMKSLVKDMMDQAKGDTGFVIMPTASPINTPLAKNTEANYYEFINSSLLYGRY